MPSSACLTLAPAAGILRVPPLGTRAGLVVEDVSALRPRAPLEPVGVNAAQLPDYLPRQIPFEQTILPNHLCPENTPITRDEAQPTMRPTGVSVKVGHLLLRRLSVHGPLRDLSHKLREPAKTREIFLSYRSVAQWRQQEVSCLHTLEGIALGPVPRSRWSYRATGVGEGKQSLCSSAHCPDTALPTVRLRGVLTKASAALALVLPAYERNTSSAASRLSHSLRTIKCPSSSRSLTRV